MKERRDFIKLSALGLVGLSGASIASCDQKEERKEYSSTVKVKNKPIVLSTWNAGIKANEEAWKILSANGRSLDAVENGVRIVELDPDNSTVGYGGTPDMNGNVTLDACIMDENDRCGSVACLQHIKNPISVARKVMEETLHVMLVGEGAFQFALSQGFKKENLLTEKSEMRYKEWLKKSNYAPPEINVENHDTIGMLAMDAAGNVSGACTTSGWGYKLPGRVGDSPIIGAGLFLDSEVGGACATGLGEEVIRVAGCAMVVEMMRQGYEPDMACKIIAERTNRKAKSGKPQVGFLALRNDGTYGGYSIRKGFNFAVNDGKGNRLENAKNVM
ncbi:N(4)-(beta-N-acetylglucosaminyl)-L-asparaginase [Reichenbachiella sp. MALMAid0571]|uniref:N(4)-(beta-N-acetylglucosaminyl)-L-asparaginase n=1 Tax=Reichenbachiella sp. MALMAid0571 TaxID=3143939 RepID=UPI0032DE5F15